MHGERGDLCHLVCLPAPTLGCATFPTARLPPRSGDRQSQLASEAGYVLGGILHNDTMLVVREHTSDTHGFTEHLFGLCTLQGVRFMPRLKDLPDQVLSRVDRAADYGPLQPLFRNTINLDLIVEQWDELVRLAASLKDG